MRFRLVACEVLAREIYHCAATCKHLVDVELLRKGLHDTPELLRAELQRRIDDVPAAEYDAILLGYGLCSNSTADLLARTKPLVMARAHDCITLYLGSRERYMKEFGSEPGTLYYTADYIERGGSEEGSLVLGSGHGLLRNSYQELVENYGEENARYLMDVSTSWAQNYTRAASIRMGLVPFLRHDEVARNQAKEKDLSYQELTGNMDLVGRLLAGGWDDDFLVIPPGGRTVASYDDQILTFTKS